jgi:hypothetical protein
MVRIPTARLAPLVEPALVVVTVAAIMPALWWMVAALVKGRDGVDLIGALSLAGTLWVGEYLAGAGFRLLRHRILLG